MNDAALTGLKIIVERVVRPVRASMSRKLKMREEMLAHLSAVFDEEAAAGLDNEQAALQRAAHRFGNPAELTGHLQVSVPASDFLLRFLEGMALRTDESTLRRGVRFAVVTFLVCAVYSLPAFLVQIRLTSWAVFLAFETTAFYFAFHSDLMRQALDLDGTRERLWRRGVALIAAASSFLISGVTIGLGLTLSGDLHSGLTDALPLLPAVVLTSAAFMIPVDLFAAELRSHRKWMSLQIN
jgi:hypothetical protein